MPLSDNVHTVLDGDNRPAKASTPPEPKPLGGQRPDPGSELPGSELVVVPSSLTKGLAVSPTVHQLAATIGRRQVLMLNQVGVAAAQAVAAQATMAQAAAARAVAESIAAQLRPLDALLDQVQRQVQASIAPMLAAYRQPQLERLQALAGWAARSLTVRFSAPVLLAFQQHAEELARRLRVMFQGWRFAEFAGGLLRDIGRWGLAAARRARAAVLYGDEEELLAFIECWLGLDPTPTLVDAVVMVLLSEDWLASGPVDHDDARAVLGWLRRRAIAEHRVHKPVWRTQVRGRPVRLLQQPVALGQGRFADLAELVADPGSAAPFAAVEGGYADARLTRLLGRLAPQERAVVDAVAAGAPSWAQAARAAGLPPEFGDVVRRRTQHHRDRVAAQLPPWGGRDLGRR